MAQILKSRRCYPILAVKVVVLLLGASVGYLLANGLNALNIQVRQIPVKAVITASDLSLQPNASGMSTVQQTLSEFAPGNPVTNTIFRNLILPRAARKPFDCEGVISSVNRDILDVGLSQQPWMATLIPNALETKSMRVAIDATNSSVNVSLGPKDFPMNASTAADLIATAVILEEAYLPWGKGFQSQDMKVAEEYFPLEKKDSYQVVPTGRITGLLPPELDSTELQDREWFLKHSASFVATAAENFSTNFSSNDLSMELSHAKLAPSVWVDAVTFDRDLDHSFLTNEKVKHSEGRLYVIGDSASSLSRAFITMEPRGKTSPVWIDAYALCENNDGSPTLMSNWSGFMIDYNVICPKKSSTSLLVVSSSHRLVADTLIITGEEADADVKESEQVGRGRIVLVNLRNIFSVTFARISWEVEDLSKTYGAECGLSNTCMGLRAPLFGTNQHLLVSSSNLPLNDVSLVKYNATRLETYQLPRQLMRVVLPHDERLKSVLSSQVGDDLRQDVLLPHNVGKIQGNLTGPHSCIQHREERIQTLVDTHMYIENTLQAAYTGGAFFLFQNGVVRDVIQQGANTTTLAFDGNTQQLSVRVSIPSLNVNLILAGCVLLLGLLLAVVFWSQFAPTGVSDPMLHITTPHVIARVMVDEVTFPPYILHREVTESEQDKLLPAEDFFIDAISLQQRSDDDDDLNVHV